MSYYTTYHKRYISFMLLLCSAVSLAIFCLFAFHTWLVITNQSNIEFYANMKKRKVAVKQGNIYINPYDISLFDNMEQILGSKNVLLAFNPFYSVDVNDGTNYKTIHTDLLNNIKLYDTLDDNKYEPGCVPQKYNDNDNDDKT